MLGLAGRSRVAQLVEQVAVNHFVGGSSPSPGAISLPYFFTASSRKPSVDARPRGEILPGFRRLWRRARLAGTSASGFFP